MIFLRIWCVIFVLSTPLTYNYPYFRIYRRADDEEKLYLALWRDHPVVFCEYNRLWDANLTNNVAKPLQDRPM